MPRYRTALPQLDGSLYLTDAGLETDLIFNHGIELRAFASHTILHDPQAMALVRKYFEDCLVLARDMDAGFILDTLTWRAHPHWAAELGETTEQLRAATQEAVRVAVELRDRADNPRPVVINAVTGPCGDAYRPEQRIDASRAERYFAEQLGWVAATEADMVTALTFTQASEAVGFVRAAASSGLPSVVSFTVETDGRLPDGQPLCDAIEQVDSETDAEAAYFMINCAHPDHFSSALDGAAARRIRGVRANASRRSHAELDNSAELDTGDPEELGELHARIARRLPWLNIFGGCCGSDIRHITCIAHSVTRQPQTA